MAGSLPEGAFFAFQMTFAVITPALIVGAYPERVNSRRDLVLRGLVVAGLRAGLPLDWGGGWLAEMGVMDFAGGLVVHATAGVSALVIAVMVGRRRGFPNALHRRIAPV